MFMIKAVIMAGGKGTRIRPLTIIRPKPMVPVVNRPLIDYVIETIKNSKVREIIVTLSYFQSHIKSHLKQNDLNIKYIVEKRPMGTAGGVMNALKYIDDTFFVLSGDVLIDLDLNKLLKFHREKKAIATIVLTTVDDPTHYGIAVLDENDQIVKFLEKPSRKEVFSKVANTGTYVLEPEVFDYIEPRKGEIDFSKDIFPVLIEKKAGIFGYTLDGYWNDVGRPETYLKANYDVLDEKIRPKPKGHIMKEGVGRLGNIWVGDDVHIDESVRIVGPVFIGDHCSIEKGCTLGKNTVLNKHVYVENNCIIKGSVIFPNTLIKANSHLKDCIVDEESILERSSVIGSGAILGSSVLIGHHSTIRSDTSIYNEVEIYADSIVDSDIR
jgi:mannose-1-phosphate guanylyltransferase